MYSIKMTFSADWNWKRLVWERELWKWEGAQAAFCQIRASVQRKDYPSANQLEGFGFFLLCTFNKARNRATCSLTTRGSAYAPPSAARYAHSEDRHPMAPAPRIPPAVVFPPWSWARHRPYTRSRASQEAAPMVLYPPSWSKVRHQQKYKNTKENKNKEKKN